jgi:hypothetical protein
LRSVVVMVLNSLVADARLPKSILNS